MPWLRTFFESSLRGILQFIGWSLTSTAMYSGSASAGITDALGGEAWQGALSGMTTGLAGSGFSALGSSLLSNGKTIGSGIANLAFEAGATTTTSILGNWVTGRDPLSSLNIGIGPFSLALRDGEVSWNFLDNLNNYLFVAAQYKGIKGVINGTADFKFDKGSMSWAYKNKTLRERTINGTLDKEYSFVGPYNQNGQTYLPPNASERLVWHENIHQLTRRVAQDSYLSVLFRTLRKRYRSLFRFDNVDGRLAPKISGWPEGY